MPTNRHTDCRTHWSDWPEVVTFATAGKWRRGSPPAGGSVVQRGWSFFFFNFCFVCFLMQASKRSAAELCGRTDGNMKVIFPRGDGAFQPGDYVQVKVGPSVHHPANPFAVNSSLKSGLHRPHHRWVSSLVRLCQASAPTALSPICSWGTFTPFLFSTCKIYDVSVFFSNSQNVTHWTFAGVWA